jgi:hypothetical protein
MASRIRWALRFVPAKNIVIAPDRGMKYLPREIAIGKMRATVEGAKIVRAEVEEPGPFAPPVTATKSQNRDPCRRREWRNLINYQVQNLRFPYIAESPL